MKKNKLEIAETILLSFINLLDKHAFFRSAFLMLCGIGISIAYADKLAIIIGALK